MENIQIIIPENFRVPRYMNSLWLDSRRHWSDEDLRLLVAANDMRLDPTMAANSLGRAPSILAHKARELRLSLPRSWYELIATKRISNPRLNLEYPYVVKPDDRHSDLIAVNRIVSRQLPGREDVCQDIMLALWESRTSLDELKSDPKAIRSFVKAFRKASFERSGYAESMDVTIHSENGDGRSKYEDARYQRTLVNQDDQFLESMILDKRRNHGDFSDSLIDEIAEEEEQNGVPAAFWMRAELK